MIGSCELYPTTTKIHAIAHENDNGPAWCYTATFSPWRLEAAEGMNRQGAHGMTTRDVAQRAPGRHVYPRHASRANPSGYRRSHERFLRTNTGRVSDIRGPPARPACARSRKCTMRGELDFISIHRRNARARTANVGSSVTTSPAHSLILDGSSSRLF